uniref:Uncharacterized protein n=1 Tax=Romanomermis culicivorax TaxID=13658 RepID=A0A915HZ40_ROMCU
MGNSEGRGDALVLEGLAMGVNQALRGDGCSFYIQAGQGMQWMQGICKFRMEMQAKCEYSNLLFNINDRGHGISIKSE